MNTVLVGPNILKEKQHIHIIKQNLTVAQDMKKSYANQHSVHKEFQVGEHVYLRIKPKKSSLRIGSRAKFTPIYFWPFEILERIGTMAYRIALPPSVKVHSFFHVYLLKIYVKDSNHVIGWYVL